MASKRLLVGATAVALVAGGVAIAFGSGSSGGGEALAATVAATTPAETAEVVRRDLVQTKTVSGTLTYGDQRSVSTSNASSSSSSSSTSGAASGVAASAGSATASSSSDAEVITALPAVGTVIDRGGMLYEVNGAVGPVLMFGARPMWRTLSTSSDDGADVLQIEENLAALGFTDDGDLTVDDEYTSSTAAAVEDWQESLGLDETGKVTPGDVWFTGSAVRVSEQVAAVGDAASGSILGVTGTARYVHVDLDPEDSSLVTAGDDVLLTLADGSEVSGIVFALGEVATVTESQGMNGSSSTTTTTLVMTVVLKEEAEHALDESPVSVDLVTSRAADVLAVPVSALVALGEGGYAVEVVRGDGTTELTGVDAGKFADGFVEVSGEVAEGDEVVTA